MHQPRSAGGHTNFKLVIPLYCPNIVTRDWESLLRRDVLPKTTLSCDSTDFNQIFSKISVLWIVDGWDEATPEALGLMRNLLNVDASNNTFVVASRPEHSLLLTGKTFPNTKNIKLTISSFENKECEALVTI